MDCEGGVSKQKEGSVFLKEAWDSKIFIRKYAANLQKITLGKPWSGVFFKSAASKRTILTKFLIRLYLGQKLLSIKQEICLYCADIVIWNSQFFVLLKKKSFCILLTEDLLMWWCHTQWSCVYYEIANQRSGMHAEGWWRVSEIKRIGEKCSHRPAISFKVMTPFQCVTVK